LRTLARTAVGQDQLDRLRSAATGDIDLRWRALIRSSELGVYDQTEVDALTEQDPDPEAWVRAQAVQAARPDSTAKQGVWAAAVHRHEVPLGSLAELSTAFWRPGPTELLALYAESYRAAMPTMHEAGMMTALSVSGFMFPWFGGDERFADNLVASAEEPGVRPLVRATRCGANGSAATYAPVARECMILHSGRLADGSRLDPRSVRSGRTVSR
jgi:aminopeptidase N